MSDSSKKQALREDYISYIEQSGKSKNTANTTARILRLLSFLPYGITAERNTFGRLFEQITIVCGT